MTELAKIIRDQIRRFGPITVGDYMTLCLLHPKHGYYTTRDPLGASGDFTTAPEISQMFGEMLALVLAQSWQDQGRPRRFLLAELGPGRGSLMADVLRVLRQVDDMLEGAEIWLVEASPALKEVQKNRLRGHTVNWAARLEDLPEAPLFLLANEFFDALPIRQFIRAENGWQERMIGLQGDSLAFGLAAPLPVAPALVGPDNARVGQIIETCPPAQTLTGELARRIAAFGGLALITDYGGWGSDGDTFQAVRDHKKEGPLENPGNADLTAHVDFAAIAGAATGVAVSGLTPQGVLLERLGITARAQALAAKLSGPALENHIAAHHRLTHPDAMGTLFKAMALTPELSPLPPGFDLNEP